MVEIEQANNLLILELRKLARNQINSESVTKIADTSEARTVKHLKSVLDRISQ